MEKFFLPERNGAAVWKGESGHGNVCQDGAADGVRYQHGGGSLGFERRRAEDTVQAQQREMDGIGGTVSGSLETEAILKVVAEFGENGGLRGGAEVPGHDNGKFSMLGSYFPQGIKQVLKLFTVDEAECMEIFPAGGGVQVEAMFKRFQTDVDEPNRQRDRKSVV